MATVLGGKQLSLYKSLTGSQELFGRGHFFLGSCSKRQVPPYSMEKAPGKPFVSHSATRGQASTSEGRETYNTPVLPRSVCRNCPLGLLYLGVFLFFFLYISQGLKCLREPITVAE